VLPIIRTHCANLALGRLLQNTPSNKLRKDHRHDRQPVPPVDICSALRANLAYYSPLLGGGCSADTTMPPSPRFPGLTVPTMLLLTLPTSTPGGRKNAVSVDGNRPGIAGKPTVSSLVAIYSATLKATG